MPQNLYLSEVDVLSNGECAALSNSMALAISQGKEDVLIANLYKATAASKDPKILNFRKNLSSLHDNVAYSFHGSQPVKRMTYKDIIGELGNATVTTTFKISDKGHGVIAGVIVENNNKSFFLRSEFRAGQVSNSAGYGESIREPAQQRKSGEYIQTFWCRSRDA